MICGDNGTCRAAEQSPALFSLTYFALFCNNLRAQKTDIKIIDAKNER